MSKLETVEYFLTDTVKKIRTVQPDRSFSITWIDKKGNQLVKMDVGGDDNILITFRKGGLKGIEIKMQERNRYGNSRNERLKSDNEQNEETDLKYRIIPNNNPSLQKTDFETSVDIWVKSSGF